MTPELTTALMNRLADSWPWYVIRGSGIAAAIILAVLIISGIGQITGFTFRVLEPLKAWATHRRLGIAFTIAALVHVGTLLFDKYQKFDVQSLLIPFISSYKPLWVGLGVIALYLTLAITLTSLNIIHSHTRIWRFTHFMSYAVLALVFLHGLFAGTDLASGWLRIAWIIGWVGVASLLISRVKRAGSI